MKRQFAKIFVISLKDSTDRRNKITSKMKILGLNFEFIDAVDGRKGLPEKYQSRINYKKISKRLGRNVTSTELGCALSHALLYEKIVNEKISHTIILEDDVILDNDFAKMVKSNYFQATKFDMLMLYHYQARIIENHLVDWFDKYKVGNAVGITRSTAGYYINYKMAQKLYKKTQIIEYVADWNIDTAKKNIGIVIPRVVRHPKLLNSVINNERLAQEILMDKTINTQKKLFYKSKSLRYIREFGILSFLKYKWFYKKSILVSRKVDGK